MLLVSKMTALLLCSQPLVHRASIRTVLIHTPCMQLVLHSPYWHGQRQIELFSRKKRRFQAFLFTSFLMYLQCFYIFRSRLKQDYLSQGLGSFFNCDLCSLLRYTAYRGERTFNDGKITKKREKSQKNGWFSQNARLNGHARLKTDNFSTLSHCCN